MNRFFDGVAANEALRTRIGQEIAAGTLSHAYIIEGPRGSGKHTLALQISAALSCERRTDASSPLPCKRCPSCQKILGGNSPDVITIGREDKATLGVEAIRKLKTDVWVMPNDTDVKIYLIEDAHLMTVQAQNALLLTLEEPPSYVLFFLLCESTAPLLETIRSRAQTLHTEPVPSRVMDDYLCRHSSDASALKATNPTEYYEILATADGKLGMALELLDPKARKPLLEQRATAREFIRLCSERRSSEASLRYLNSLSQKRDHLTAQLSTVLLCLRDLILTKQTENAPLCFFADAEEAASLAYHFTMPELLRLSGAINEAIDRLRVNANIRLTLISLAVQAGMIQI